MISFVDQTGIRYPSEIGRILVSDVNLQKGYVMIRDRKSKSEEPVNTKMPLSDKAIKILEDLLSREGIPKGPKDRVFVNDKGVFIKYINKAFKKSLLKLNLNPTLSMYSFRRTYATRLVQDPEIPMKIVAYMMGHKDCTMVDRIYSNIGDDEALKLMQRIKDKKNKKNSLRKPTINQASPS